MIAEYSQISTMKPQTVFKVIRGEDNKRHGEASFKAEEKGCRICGLFGHFWKSCKFNNDTFTLEQNQRWFKKKHKTDSSDDYKVPGEGPKGGSATTGAGAGGATVKKSTTSSAPKPNASAVQSDAKSEQAKVAREIDTTEVVEAGLDSEEFGLVCQYEGDVIDLLLDTGTVSNLVPEGQRGVVHDVRNEPTSLIGVGGARVMATETGQAGVFGKSRIVPELGRFVFHRDSSVTSSK